MSESGYYPQGAEHDQNAPYNQVDPSEKEFKVTATFCLDKEVTVSTSDYIAEEDWDDDMGKCASIDTSNTNWLAAYQEQHETIEDLLTEFKLLLQEQIESTTDTEKFAKYKYLKEECEGWVTHDIEIVE